MLDTEYRQMRDLDLRDQPPRAFFREFVELFSRMANVELGLGWNCDTEPFSPICQVMRDPEAMVQLPLSSERHEKLLRETHEKRIAALVSPPASESSNPSKSPAILLCPLQRAGEQAIAEFILPAMNSDEQNQQTLKQLAECCRLTNSNSNSSAANPAAATAGELPKSAAPFDVASFSSTIHESLDFEETASNVANEMRRILDCDRVTVFRKRARNFRATAISGQPSVNQRSNEVRALGKLADAVLHTRRAFWFPHDDDLAHLPVQIETPLNDYIQESLTRSLAVIPIFAKSQNEPTDPTNQDAKPEVIGGLVIEQANNQWQRAEVEPRVTALTQQAETALRNADEVNSILFYPLWKTLGRAKALVFGRHQSRFVFGAIAATLAVLAMIFVPADFDLACDGELVPRTRRNIFSDQVGIVTSVEVEHGDDVAQGDVLLRLSNEELDIQIEQLEGEAASLGERLIGSRSIRITNRSRDEGSNEVSQRELQAQIDSLRRRLKTLEAKRERLTVIAPISGKVLTWDIENVLKNRPIRQGDLLLEVADTDGPWELTLELPDRKAGHLLAANNGDEPLQVRFTMASDPTKEFEGLVDDVARSTSVSGDSLHVVRIKADVESNDFGELKQTGSTVSAKIHCGKRRLGFVWLHDAWEFLQYRVLFRLFG